MYFSYHWISLTECTILFNAISGSTQASRIGSMGVSEARVGYELEDVKLIEDEVN